MRRATDLG